MKMRYTTPLRYPGGKSKLSNFMKLVFMENDLVDGHYVETYAGGAGVAFSLLFEEYASNIHINDLNKSIYCVGRKVTSECAANPTVTPNALVMTTASRTGQFR